MVTMTRFGELATVRVDTTEFGVIHHCYKALMTGKNGQIARVVHAYAIHSLAYDGAAIIIKDGRCTRAVILCINRVQQLLLSVLLLSSSYAACPINCELIELSRLRVNYTRSADHMSAYR